MHNISHMQYTSYISCIYCIYIYIHIYSLSQFIITCLYICSGLTAWTERSIRGLILGDNLFSYDTIPAEFVEKNLFHWILHNFTLSHFSLSYHTVSRNPFLLCSLFSFLLIPQHFDKSSFVSLQSRSCDPSDFILTVQVFQMLVYILALCHWYQYIFRLFAWDCLQCEEWFKETWGLNEYQAFRFPRTLYLLSLNLFSSLFTFFCI